MNKFSRFSAATRSTYAKVAMLPLMALAAVQAHAAGEATGIDAMLDAVDLSGISTKVAAAGLLIVGIALVFKGPALAKRIISKV